MSISKIRLDEKIEFDPIILPKKTIFQLCSLLDSYDGDVKVSNVKSKIKFEIHQLNREMTKAYEKLGKLAYSHTKEDHMATFSGNTDFFGIVSKVENIKEEIILKFIIQRKFFRQLEYSLIKKLVN